MRVLFGSACIAAGILAAGCQKDKQDERPPVRGSFEAIGTSAGALPQQIGLDPMCKHYLQHGYAAFGESGKYSSRYKISHVCEGFDTAVDYQGVNDGQFQMSGDSILFFDDNGNVSGSGLMVGPDTLHIRGSLQTIIFTRR